MVRALRAQTFFLTVCALRFARHPALLAATVVLLGALVLLPGLRGPGLWEPQEMAIADEAAARADGTYQAPVSTTACPTKPDPDGARTLTPRLAAAGLHHGGPRLPMALIGLLGLLAIFGVGWRLGSPRAGLVAGLVAMSFPLWSLQARMLTSELPGAAGATLIMYGLVVIAAPRRARALGLTLDLVVAFAALALGGHLAFHGSGALVGLLPPFAAVGFAGAFALAPLGRGVRAAWRALDRRRVHQPDPAPLDLWHSAAVLLATVIAVGLSLWIARQVFDLGPRTPGTRQLFDHSILTSDCWSRALGGVWRKDDDLRATYDSLFEQAGFGMFPWSILAVIALGALASGLGGVRRRFAGAVLFGWAAAGWICAAVFARKVGLVVFPGFPACAIAIGLFVDELYLRRAEAAIDARPYREAGWSLLALAVLFGTLVLAKDLQEFPERMTSFLVGGGELVKYPASSRLLGVPTKAWILGLGILAALPFALDVWLWRPRRAADVPPSLLERTGLPAIAPYGMPAALVATVLLALFWTHGWHRQLSLGISSKHIFQVYQDQRKAGDELGILGNLGNGPRYYADAPWTQLGNRPDLLAFLAHPNRVFALAPAGELCAIHQERGTTPYFVLDDTNTQTLLLSNQLGRGRDHNPIATAILRERPADVGAPLAIVYDGTIEVVGIKLPEAVDRGDSFEVTLTYHVLKPVPGSWKVFVHFDNGSIRFPGDHDPIRGRCATSYWQTGDYIVDRFTVKAGNQATPKRSYDLWAGFFQGSFPNYRNMPVSQGTKDGNNRVKLGTIRVR